MTLLRNTIIHADCTQFLPGLPSESVDFILTDPPYLVSYKPRDGRAVGNDNNDAWLKPAFAEMHRVLAADGFCLTFYGWPHADKFMQAFPHASPANGHRVRKFEANKAELAAKVADWAQRRTAAS